MHRFFAPVTGGNVQLCAEDINHISNVLRLKQGEEIIVCDGQKNDYLCRIKEISKKHIEVETLSVLKNESEPKCQITLFQGLPKADKMELIIQKCVELGIYKIVPVETERSIVKIKDGGEKKTARWQGISLSAAKQCGRGIVPEIGGITTFKDALKQMAAFPFAFMPYELQQGNSLGSAVESIKDKASEIAIFIGPEGGISDEEAQLCKDANIVPVTLGKRILRTETAGFAALIMIFSALGEYDE
ncbi:16S rRNA (uracil(1498)-N(3))-methyltransferase [Tyzzerella sp. OttesenSCG-928-J15]|nr:16S rRNA (uracil(1498)-N(3))-methyltransferase [Tyzzerella sp. OttesenSCG-928-J15]